MNAQEETSTPAVEILPSNDKNPSSVGLKKVTPYWHPYTTMAKGRWLGRELLEVVSTEYRDRSMDFYRYAIESGVTTINGVVAKADHIFQNGDRLENVVHRHEPAVTSTPVKILHHDKERGFIVINKPGSIPVHATGRYFYNSLAEILKNDFGFEKPYTVNRLDRLTSGLMILPLNAKLATKLTEEFVQGKVKKEYIARCEGRFPEEDVVCEEPLLTIDRQMGLNVVHPEGKPAKTLFRRIRYDEYNNTSVIHCFPQTGRSHQIRVHLQFLGHPIANDPLYSDPRIWGDKLGKGGIDTTPSDERSAPQAPAHLVLDGPNPESLSPSPNQSGDAPPSTERKLFPRETGHDIGMGAPVPLSAQAVDIITRLRNMKDEDEDWGRWRDVVFRAKGKLMPSILRAPVLHEPPPKKRAGRRKEKKAAAAAAAAEAEKAALEEPTDATPAPGTDVAVEEDNATAPQAEATPVADSAPAEDINKPAQITEEDVMKLAAEDASAASQAPPPAPELIVDKNGMYYCSECFVPLHEDSKPETLYIFLHALRYTTSLGTFETEMPEWAAEGWDWAR
ncbi:pseudouridine synthase [Epithele typhae]|uniref:pseudouridine synthase n=1 Tax=Epithele typhae TaxID=378194 RepID=UPI00200876C6|nr:pseudouridine synthase [Epithele typhae]KAH9935201.1 pseudouridine synthase [Epithele typhae]